MIKILDLLFPGKARLQKELAEAKEELVPLSENLVKWEGDELELMSLIQEERKIKSAFSKETSGILCSIYHEHMASYIWKKLSGFAEMQILVINTRKYTYEYVTKSGKTSFYVNNQFLGEFRKDNKLYLSRKRILAEIRVDRTEWWEVFFDGKLAGSLVNISTARHVNPRAFQIQRDITQDAEMVFLSVALYMIVHKTKDLKKIPFR